MGTFLHGGCVADLGVTTRQHGRDKMGWVTAILKPRLGLLQDYAQLLGLGVLDGILHRADRRFRMRPLVVQPMPDLLIGGVVDGSGLRCDELLQLGVGLVAPVGDGLDGGPDNRLGPVR